ncbi:MAG: hypothetical protein QF691_07755 [SAR324 cluster bacterium]|nr:hypothetical protein [SAR324 cluster bacterium]
MISLFESKEALGFIAPRGSIGESMELVCFTICEKNSCNCY